MQKLDLSIIIPAFNEAQSIPQLYNLITDKLSEKLLSYEVIFIDDGSNDDTWKEMEKITISDKKPTKKSWTPMTIATSAI